MNVDTFFFDMDGTLLDTEGYYNICWCKAINEFGYPITSEEALELRSLGRPHVYGYFEERYGKNFPYEQIRSRRKELMEEMIARNGIALKPGAESVLSFLREKGKRCMIATATDTERTERYLKKTGIYEYFDRIISAAMVENGKPSPDIYEYACRAAKREPKQCIAIEDSPNGVKSAAAAGCRVIMIPDKTEPNDTLKQLCEGVFPSLTEARLYFEKIIRS